MIERLTKITSGLLPQATYSFIVKTLISPFILIRLRSHGISELRQGFLDKELDEAKGRGVIIYDCTRKENLLKVSEDFLRMKSSGLAESIVLVQSNLSPTERRRAFGYHPAPNFIFSKGRLNFHFYSFIFVLSLVILVAWIVSGAFDMSTMALSFFGFIISSIFVKGIESGILDASLVQSNSQVMLSLISEEAAISEIRKSISDCHALSEDSKLEIINRCSFHKDCLSYFGEVSSDQFISQKCSFLTNEIDFLTSLVDSDAAENDDAFEDGQSGGP